MICEKIGKFLTTSSTDSAILKVLYLKIVLKVCVTIKENHKEITEKLDVDLFKSDHINQVLILIAGLSDKLGSACRFEVAVQR